MKSLENVPALRKDLISGRFFRTIQNRFLGVSLPDKVRLINYLLQYEIPTEPEYKMIAFFWLEKNGYEKLPLKDYPPEGVNIY